MKKRILILSQAQYGSVIAPYQYTRYLKDRFDFTYLCWDYGSKRVEEPDVSVVYVSRGGRKATRLLRFIHEALREITKGRYDLVFVVYFQGAFLLPLLARRERMVLDIRTGYIRASGFQRWLNNALITFETFFFKHVTILADSLREDLHIPARKCCLVPLGAEHAEFPPKSFEDLRLLYVGTLERRFIEKTVVGFSRFCEEMRGCRNMSYVIVGGGRPVDKQRLQEAIEQSPCANSVHYVGWVDHKDLGKYFHEANIGVAFVPLEDRYQAQPATKVFEYLLAGMPVIATKTRENVKSINDTNGVLVSDTPEDFCHGLHALVEASHRYDSVSISRASRVYSWRHIINGQLYPYLVALMEGG